MSSIVVNQQRAFLARSQDAARRLADELRALSPAQQAAILALTAAAAATPTDMVLLGVQGDQLEAAAILDGVLSRGEQPWSWDIGSGCTFTVAMLPREETHEH